MNSGRLIVFLLLFAQISFGQSLKLPFFDDFSIYTGPKADTKLWINGGGTTINNSFGIGQPSMYVATFDGRNQAGLPYDFVNKTATGYTDSLTSRPIDLSGIKANDHSVYLSFYWQAKGLGDLPEDGDSLLLSFLDKKNHWNTVWGQNGGIVGDSAKKFFQQLVSVSDTNYFHKNFQFRFVVKGRQSGPFDTWNIDYVYLNSGRDAKDIYFKDIAWRQINSTLLKRYYAMPLNQYLVNPVAETNDTLKAEIFNLQPSGNLIFYNVTVKDTATKTLYQSFTPTEVGNLEPLNSATKIVKLSPLPNVSPKKALYLKYQFNVQTTDKVNPFGIDMTRNDSIAHYVILADYYAYDDGTAEIGADIDKKFGKVAVKFILNKPDTVSSVRMNFSPYFTDISGQYFLLQVYDSKNGLPNKLLSQQSVQVRYPKTINDFNEYPLDINVAVKDTFYVGFTKISDNVVAVGVDKNTPQFADKIYYNTGSEWIQNTSVKGSLMIRPVMGAKNAASQKILANENEKTDNLIAFPNPNDGILHWNLPNIKQVKIIDISGKILLQKNIQSSDNQEISLELLETGTYFVNFSDGNKSYTKKILKVK